MLRRALLAGILVLLNHTTFAQMSERMTVEVIDVPVYVSDARGPVRGLTRDRFELFVNGKRREIEYFDEIDLHAASAEPLAPAIESPATQLESRRLFLLVFDLAFTRPAAIDRARRAAVAMIDAAMPEDSFAVTTFTQRDGLQFVVPFTTDRALARRAAMHLSLAPQRDPFALAMSKSDRAAFSASESPAGKLQNDELVLNPVLVGLSRWTAEKDNNAMPMKRVIASQVAGLDEIAAQLARLEGFKRVVLLSEGFSPFAVYANPYAMEPAIITATQTMFQSFHRANAVVDTIDLGGDVRDSFLNDALHYVARETGGTFIQHENDVGRALQRISSVSSSGYRLGFRRPADARKGANTIEVKVRDLPMGTTVTFRRGFSTAAPREGLDWLQLADILLNDIPQRGVAPRIAFREPPYLEVEVPSFLEDEGAAEVMLYVFDSEGAVVEWKHAKRARAGTLRTKLELPAGTYVAKAILCSGESVGFARLSFNVP